MAGERTLPGLGLLAFWDLGDNSYKDGLDGNLRVLSAMVQPRILSLLAAEPGSPTDGDIHIATAVWAGATAGDIVIRDDGSWVLITPQIGWQVYDVSSGDFRKYNGTVWVAVTGGLFVGTYLTDAALTAAHPDPAIGSSAHVDAGVGELVSLWIWDEDDSEWASAGSASGGDMTGTEIVDAIDLELGSDDWQGGDGGGGGLAYTAFNERYFCLPNHTALSSSAFATKGTVFDCLTDTRLTSVSGYFSTGQDIKCVVAHVEDSGTQDILSIIGESGTITTESTEERTMQFAQALTMESGKRYAIMFVRTDGGATTAASLTFVSSVPGTDWNGIWDFVSSTRYASVDPGIGDGTFYATNGAVRMTLNTVVVGSEVLIEDILVPVVLTASHTVTDADLSGGRFVRMDVAAANTVTIPPGLTGKNAVTFIQDGLGATSFVAGAGVTIKSPEGNTDLRVRYSTATLVPDGFTADEYFLMGDLV